MPIFLLPLLAEGGVALAEGAVVLAESAAVRAAVAEAASVVISAETRQAATAFVTNEARVLAAQVGTAEGRAAIVEGVGKGASEVAAEVASKSSRLLEIGKNLMASEEGAAAVSSFGKQAAGYLAKTAAIGTAMSVAWEGIKAGTEAAVMSKINDFLSTEQTTEADKANLATTAASFGTENNLAKDMQALSSDLAKAERPMDHLPEIKEGVLMARAVMPEKTQELEGLFARADVLDALKTAEGTVKREAATGTVSHESAEKLKTALSDAIELSDAKSKPSLTNAMESLKEAMSAKGPLNFGETLSELGAAKDRMMQSISQEISHIAAQLSHSSEQKKEEMAKAVDALTPALISKNDKEYAKEAEVSKEISHDKQASLAKAAPEQHSAQAQTPPANQKTVSYTAFMERQGM